jgi:hypothetical protein
MIFQTVYTVYRLCELFTDHVSVYGLVLRLTGRGMSQITVTHVRNHGYNHNHGYFWLWVWFGLVRAIFEWLWFGYRS